MRRAEIVLLKKRDDAFDRTKLVGRAQATEKVGLHVAHKRTSIRHAATCDLLESAAQGAPAVRPGRWFRFRRWFGGVLDAALDVGAAGTMVGCEGAAAAAIVLFAAAVSGFAIGLASEHYTTLEQNSQPVGNLLSWSSTTVKVTSKSSDQFSYLDIGRVFGAKAGWIGDAFAGSCVLARACSLGSFASASQAAT